MRLFDPSAQPGDNPIARQSVTSAALLTTVTFKVTVIDGGGAPAAGQLVKFGAVAAVQPELRGGYLSEVAVSYPPVIEDPLNPPPPPQSLVFRSAPTYVSSELWRRSYSDADGVATVTMPSPAALAYAAGARTDADMDPARGGRYSVLYYLLLPGSEVRTFTLANGQVTEAQIDVTALVMRMV
jgi:hypothetical protein